ncbi:restriction endonuclease subunit S [Methylotenera sp.]|uniref:restriction endonuclease subunit S n=1 Tax=Methylotenera sp. TaxID=2051956 RepID=UPI0027176EAE|nr:restriction endonuclease subunit S [Methylotenera sp.]MDO9204057.1 restriction endonuclease subunit S [Methylotenera sp.]
MSAIQQLITEHMDIWTVADTRKRSGRGRASSNAGSVYGVKKLRELILELAVCGKLVPQDNNDEPANELLKRIQVEKAKLVAEGKIKKNKPLAVIADDEQPFELPQGWEWTSLLNVAVINPRNAASDDIEASFVPMTLIGSAFNYKHQDEKRLWKEIKQGFTHFAEGDIGVAKITPCFENSKACVFENLENGLGAGTTELHIVRPVVNTLNPRYVLAYLKSPRFLELGESKMTGTAGQKRLPKDFVESNPFPLPPLPEQHRIVAKVDELMTLCDQLEAQHSNAAEAHEKLVSHLLGTLTQSQSADDFSSNWHRIAAYFEVLFTTEASIDALKQTLLQLAVMGKLVPQEANDESASELLKRIQAEKLKLVAEGKIKKDKPLAPIGEDGKPFELPKNWKWVQWIELTAINDAAFKRGPFGSSLRKDMFVSSGYKVYEQYCPINDDCSFERYFVTKEKFDSMKDFAVKANDFLISCSGVTLGRITQVPEVFNEGIINQALLRVRMNREYIDSDFFKLLFRSPYFQKMIFENSTGSAIPNVKGVQDLKKMAVPFLPIAEQKRIVAKVDALIAICDQLQIRINQVSRQQQLLADSFVAHAVAV